MSTYRLRSESDETWHGGAKMVLANVETGAFVLRFDVNKSEYISGKVVHGVACKKGQLIELIAWLHGYLGNGHLFWKEELWPHIQKR